MFDEQIVNQLELRNRSGLQRIRRVVDPLNATRIIVEGKEYVNFSGNDYLGIASDSQVSKAFDSGATASPLVTGRGSIHLELEQQILAWLGANDDYDCMLFSSGFSANNGVINALFSEKNIEARLYQDKLNHASLLDAGKHIQAQRHGKQYRFNHNDFAHLQTIMAKNHTRQPNLVVTEGVFSMDGDSPELHKLNNTIQPYNSWLMLDDAHGIGVLGKDGAGSLAHQGLSLADCDLYIMTFGKAIGSQGAAVIAKKSTIEYLTNFSREYIYSTHLSPLQTHATIDNINTIKQQQWRRDKLAENIAYFKKAMVSSPYQIMNSQSAIQPILIGEEKMAVNISEKLKSFGIWAGAMRYPTVAKGKARLRVTISAIHEYSDIDLLVSLLAKISVKS